MKKIIAMLVCAICIGSCNTVTTDHYILTDKTADGFAPKYRYWQSDDLDENGANILELRGFEKGKKQKLWLVDAYPKGKKDIPIYFRLKAISNGKKLIQLTSWDNGTREISLSYGYLPNDSTFVLYGYEKSIFETVRSSQTLKDFREHISIEDTEVTFDSIAATTYRKPLLRFLDQELSDAKHLLADSIVFKGSNRPDAF